MSDTPSPGTSQGPIVTRFAPSPTGRLHLGHAYSALFAWSLARAAGGRFLLRLEDIDGPRCDPVFEQGIYDDLAWLGIDWDGPVLRQSARSDAYRAALARLEADGLLYPCFCSRKDIRAEIERSGSAPHGPLGAVYPGTCRALDAETRETRVAAGEPYALRLDSRRAMALAGTPEWIDRAHGRHKADPEALGDVVLARKETGSSYHLAVTLDDAYQGVTLVTRGEDLLEATGVHRVLQALLDLPVPEWYHHGLLTGADGQRLAKRDNARAIATLREAGYTPTEVRAMAGFPET